ncbi:fibronectin type III domain-containing protein [Syntrophomonas erecta]
MRLRGSTKSKIAILTALVFMLSMVFSVPLVQASDTEGLTNELLELAAEGTTDDANVLDSVYEAVNTNTGETADSDIPGEGTTSLPGNTEAELPLEPEPGNVEADVPAEGTTPSPENTGLEPPLEPEPGNIEADVPAEGTTPSPENTGLEPPLEPEPGNIEADVPAEGTTSSPENTELGTPDLELETDKVNEIPNLNNFQPMEASGPAELIISDVTNISFKVSWPEAADASEYKVTVSNTTGGETTKVVNNVSTGNLEYVVSGLESSYRYDIVVEAVGGTWAGNGSFLQGLAVTTAPNTLVLKPGAPGTNGNYTFEPLANPDSENVYEKFYTYQGDINIANDHFTWYIKKGLNNGLPAIKDNIRAFRLFNLSDKEEIELDYGSDEDFAKVPQNPNNWPQPTTINTGDFIVCCYSISGTCFSFEINLANKLQPGKQYEITLDPQFRTAGNSPQYLNKVYHFKFTTAGIQDSTPPAWPDGATLSADGISESELTISWPEADDVSGVDKYIITTSKAGGIVKTAETAALSYKFTDLDSNTEYEFSVKAVDLAKNESEALTATVITAAQVPQWPKDANLSISNVYPTELVINWPKVADEIDFAEYRVYVDGVEEARLPNQNYYELGGLNAGHKYSLKVVPYNVLGFAGAALETMVVTPGGGGLVFNFAPQAIDKGESDYYHHYELVYPVDLYNLVLTWNFGNGLDKNLRQNLECISLVEKASGKQITLDLGTEPYVGNEDGVFAAGDFTYISTGGGTGGGSGTGQSEIDDASKIRMLRFAPREATLEQMSQATEYVLEIDPEFTANNGLNTLGKIFTFSFITAGDDFEAPTWPDNAAIIVSNIGPTSVILNWPEATDNVAVSSYDILQGATFIKSVSGQITSYKVENLIPNTDYEFTVIAKDAKGNASEGLKVTGKTPLTDNEPPTWPSSSKIVPDNILTDNLDLIWTQAQDNLAVTGYQLLKNGAVVAELDAATMSYHIIGLAPATNYVFKVEARDEYGNYSKDGPEVAVRTIAGKRDITSPYWTNNGSWNTSTVYDIRETRTTLTWPWAADNVAVYGYEVYREGSLIATLDAYSNSYTDILVPDDNTYTYVVYALDGAGNRSTGINYSVRTGDPDPDLKSPYWPAGTYINLSEFTDTTVKVHWSEALDNIGVIGYVVIKDGLWTEYADPGEENDHRSFINRFAIYDPKYNTSGIANNYPALSPGETYTFSLKAFDQAGNGSKGDPQLTFVMGTNPTAGSKVPFALVNLDNTRGSLNSLTGALNRVTIPQDPQKVKFTWEFGEPLADGYANNITIFKADDQAVITTTEENFIYQNTEGKGVLTLDLSGIQLADEETYIVKLGKELTAQSSKQIGLDMAWQFTTAKDDKTAPVWGDGAGLKAEAIITPSVVTLTWPEATDNVAVTQYKVYRGEEWLATLPAETRSYNVEGLELEQSYQFKVIAGDYLNNFSDALEANIITPAADNEAPAWVEGTEVSCSDICSDNVTITWPEATDNYQVTAYKLYKNEETEAFVIVDGTSTTHKITGLQGETKYTIRIVALDAVGNVSEEIAGEIKTAPDNVQPIWPENSQLQTKNIKDISVTLYWTAATDNVGVVKYNIYQDDELITDVNGDVTEYIVTELKGSTQYTFGVEALDAAGNVTADKLSISQWTAPNSTTSGGNFEFELLSPDAHNLDFDSENNILQNEVDASFTRNNIAFTFTFAEDLLEDTWLNNIVLTKKDGTQVELSAAAYRYEAKAGEKDARLQIIVPANLIDPNGGEYLLTLKDTLTAKISEDSVALGRNFTWAFNVYVGEYGVTNIAAGYNSFSAFKTPEDRFYLMLKDDGSVWSWGNNDYGTLGDGTYDRRDIPVQVDGLVNIVALEAGRDSCFALDKEGLIWAWGSNEYGQLGKGFLPGGTSGRLGNNTPQKITAAGFPAIKKLSFGFGHVVAIDVNGEVWNWGFNVKDGYSSEAKRSGTPLKVDGLSNVIDVAGCFDSSLAVTADGDVYTIDESRSPSKIEGLSQIVAVDGQGIDQRNTIGMALKADGTVYIWNKDDIQPNPQPKQVIGASQIRAISADGPYVLGNDGQVRTVIFDPKNSSRLGDAIPDLYNVSNLASSAKGGLALINDGSLLQFIGNETTPVSLDMNPVDPPVWPEDSGIEISNLTEAGLTLNWNKPDPDVSGFTIYQDGLKIASVSGNRLSYDIVGLEKGITYTFKVEARFAQSPWSTTGPTLEQTMLSNWDPVVQGAGKIAAGGRHTLLIDSAGNVWAWGQNDYGQLGTANKEQQLEPVKVDSLNNVVAVAAGDNHSLALDEDGNVYAWGRNNLYQLGNDTTVDSLTPTKVFEGVKAIAAAANYSLALKIDGTVWGWGEPGEANCGYALTNGNGRTPVQMMYNTNRPTDIHPFENVKGIAAAPRFAAYLFNDGRICRQGYFIDTVGAPTYSPRGHYSSLMGVQGIVAGDEFVAALLEDSTVATLGHNILGQFGNGGQSNATPASPVPYAKVKDLTNVVGIATGGAHGIALKSDGTVWPWGKNQYGQLGNGNNIVSLVPIQVQRLSGITAVAGGKDNTLAMQSDQKVYAWGDNSGGQLGSGSKLSSKLPVLVRMDGYDEAVNAPIWPASFAIMKKAQTADSITLMWTYAISDISIAGYEVYQNGNKVGEVSGNTYEYTVKKLQKGTTYTFGVKAKDSAGNVSELSNTISLSLPGEEEGGIDNQVPEWNADAVITTDGKTPYTITISWPEATDNVAVTGYRIFANGKNVGITSQTSYTIGDLSPNQEYLITVEALDAAGNVSTPIFSTIKTVVTKPVMNLAEITKRGDISLTFDRAMDDPSGTKTQFTVAVNDTPVIVTAVVKTNTPEKIKLELDSKVTGANGVSIRYTKSNDPAKQLKSTDGGIVESFTTQIGEADEPRVFKPIVDSQVVVDDTNKNLAITSSTPAATIIIPPNVTDTTLNVAELLQSTEGNQVTTQALPELKIEANTKVSTAPIKVEIPQGATITGPTGWDGTINIPKVVPAEQVKIEPDSGKKVDKVTTVIEVGAEDTVLTFTKTVKLVIPDQAGKDAGYYCNGKFTPITRLCKEDSQTWADENLPDGEDGKIDVDGDLVIWTKHFTKFITYEQTAANGSGGSGGNNGGGGGDGSGEGEGSGTSGDLKILSFNKVKLSPTDTLLQFDFGKGMDRTLSSNLNQIHVYEKTTKNEVKWSNHNYIKQGSGDDAVKLRRLELMFNNLKSGTTYIVELGAGVEANNSSTLGKKQTYEFTTSSSTSGSGGAGDLTEQTVDKNGAKIDKDYITIDIPAAACDQKVKVKIEKVAEISKLPMAEKSKLVSDVVEINKDKTGSFKKPVTITLHFDKSKVDTDKHDLSICYLDEKTNTWVALDKIKVDLKAGKVSGDIQHFTKFAVIATEKVGTAIEKPKPAEPGQVVKLSDIQTHWAQKTIEELVASGAIGGYPDGTFKPDQSITRAEFATILVKSFNLEPKGSKVFEDTAKHWAQNSISTAATCGIVSGYSDTAFGADDPINREQMAAMITRAAKLAEIMEGKAFADSDKISAWAKNAVATASHNNIITGYPDKTFRPQASATRAEAATVIVKALKLAS